MRATNATVQETQFLLILALRRIANASSQVVITLAITL
jgi:hypothetical protein